VPVRFAEGEPVSLDHLKRLTDDTGVIQHALVPIPNRKTGYTTDDNARALYVAVQAARTPATRRRNAWRKYLAFLLYAQEPDGWFHNFFSYDRRPMPETPSEDCQGRSLWALAEAARYWEGRGHGRVAAQMFAAGLDAASRLQSPRGLAGLIIACTSWLEGSGAHREATDDLGITPRAESLLEQAASRLAAAFKRNSGPGWYWCEDIVTYDNAMLPYALLRAAGHGGDPRWKATGLEALAFLSDATFPGERFSPVGNPGLVPPGRQAGPLRPAGPGGDGHRVRVPGSPPAHGRQPVVPAGPPGAALVSGGQRPGPQPVRSHHRRLPGRPGPRRPQY